MATPASWYAKTRLQSYPSGSLGSELPSRTLSSAKYTSPRPISGAPRRMASSAASFRIFSSSAPESPGVSLASWDRSTDPASTGCFWAWTSRMALLASLLGFLTLTFRSNLPGLSRASSIRVGALVAAITTIPVSGVNPSISVSSWFRAWSLSSFLLSESFISLLCPRASISSMKIRHGTFTLARLNRSLTLAAPTPTMSSVNSLPARE
mmetsp:Transcript_2427/g.7453  ORF Transcript_2427/g.7453 Transcript_2427/m.7453 type:complete len:209 (-) Transcript_2427:1269-1895(-)